MINGKCNCENEVNSGKLTVPKNSIFLRSRYCENVCLVICDATLSNTQERTPAIKLHLTGAEFT